MLTCLPAGAAAAQQNPPEEVLVSSRIPVPLRQIGSSVSVIDEGQIEAHGNLLLSDILRQLPAVQVSSDGGAGKPTSLRVRGEEGFRTLTIMDGMRLSDPGAPQIAPQLEHLLSSGIRRVEVLRGPQGLAYGADAGGVVNISTRHAEEGLVGNIDAQRGRYGTTQLSGSVAGGNDGADFFVSAAQFESDGYNVFENDSLARDRDGYENQSLHLRGGLDLGERWRAELVHRRVEGENRYDNCFSPTQEGHDCLGLFDLQATRVALDYQGTYVAHAVSYSSTDTDRNDYASGGFAFGSAGELKRWEYLGSAKGLPGFRLVFGADLEEALNNGIGRDNAGVFVEYLSDFSQHVFITAGLRHDDNDDFGRNTSHRLSAAYLIDLPDAATLKLKGSLGSGFRAPSPYEMAFNRGPWASPPAADTVLEQESSEGWEAGFEYLADSGLRLEAVYFDQQVENAIEFDPVGWSGYLQLSGVSTSKGVELSGAWPITAKLRLSANYTWNDTARPNGLQRRLRPEQLFNLGLSWSGMADSLQLNAFLRAARDAIDEQAGVVLPMEDFEVLDLSASYSLGERVQLHGRIENALDADYREILGYRMPGRAAYVGIRMRFAVR